MNQSSTVLDRLITQFPQAKKTTLRDMLAQRRVLLNGVPAKSLKANVKETDAFEVLEPGEGGVRVASPLLPEGLRIVHLDGQVLIVEKPAGLLTSTHKDERRPTVLKILSTHIQRQNNKNQMHLIHRLDRDASGLLVFARSWEAYRSLKQQFFEHTITRRYDVVVHGVFKPSASAAKASTTARLEHLLIEDENTGIVRVTTDMKVGKLAILDYEVVRNDPGRKLAHLRCTLFTGRKHQIRVQLRAIGHAVCGDVLYGRGDEPPGRLALHASYLAFDHPATHRKVRYESPMPGSFAHLFRS